MATSLQDQVTSLLSLSIAEPKTRGLPTSNVESAAILESIATNLLIYPRTILYVAHLARQGIQAAVSEELSQLEIVLEDVGNTGNPTYAITDTSDLSEAKTSLIQMQAQQKVTTANNSFTQFDNSINNFLNNQLAKNVRIPGSTSLTIPSADAAIALSGDYAQLTSLHATTLQLLYALGVGVQNFINAPISSAIGTAAAARVYNDIQDIINSIEADSSGAGSSDYTNRLIADRAALKALGSTINYTSPKIDTITFLPTGYSLKAISGEASASTNSGLGPFNGFIDSGSLILSVSGGTPITGDHTNFLQSVVGSVCNPAIEGAEVTFPVTIPANSYLFLKLIALNSLTGWSQAVDGTWTQSSVGGGWQLEVPGQTTYSQVFKIDLNSTSSPVSLAFSDIQTAIEAATGGYSVDPSTGTPFTAIQFVQAGSNQIFIYADGTKYQSISVANSYSEPNLSTPGLNDYYNNYIATSIGFQVGQIGNVNVVPAQQMVDALNILFGSLITAQLNTKGGTSILLTTVSEIQGTFLTIGGTWATILGLSGVFNSQSLVVTLQGTVLGVPTNPVNLLGLVDVGDAIELPTGTTSIASVSPTSLTLKSPLNTFPLGNITVTSALYLAWQVLNNDIQAQIQLWLSSQFGSGMGKLDLAMAALAGNSTPGTIHAATVLLEELQTMLSNLNTALSDVNSILPAGSASEEIDNSNGIVQTLAERNYDKALDFYLSCQVVQMLQLDYQTASYGGSFMSAAQAVSQNDVDYPNAALDEGLESTASPNRSGNP